MFYMKVAFHAMVLGYLFWPLTEQFLDWIKTW